MSSHRLVQAAIAAIAVLYGLSPLDLIPDMIPVLGIIDDAGVLGTAAIIYIAIGRARKKGLPQITALPETNGVLEAQ